MKILVAHNRYQGRGGEDVVFEAEVDLLRGAGHSVETLTVSNEAINSLAARIATTLSIADNMRGKQAMAEAIERFRPDIVHVHNFFPLLSPAVFDVCRQRRVPAVVTLHNYRTICTGGMLLRDGRICHKCLDRGHLWGVAHRCYRGSLPGSLASAYMIAQHQRRGTWTHPGLRLIALTQFARTLFAQAGFDAGRIDVKPNFMADPGAPDPATPRAGLLYVGRLSREKGVGVLLDAVAGTDVPLRIVGEGPERAALEARAPGHVSFLGARSRAEVLREMANAQALVVPSLWYEGFPMVVVEAFARGTPVIASEIGGLAEVVSAGKTGALAPAGDAAALRNRITDLLAVPDRAAAWGQAARAVYLARYAPDENLRLLEAIYARAAAE
ncbi:glycosyltransferase involved in cell wall biosynthesis [Bradyrhizobium macuxiense]|uniref:Glycosyltransferase involved in cell wall biosynthesis n=1 Tax=Bradyrhizobium macuxiense TaxID=1755647 RepID=A0A560MDX0_9BRAD|nr:glycosyltransferase [Bradyrhizobium macuxiense]TWC05823.1 glycosyltransferase involved in cell wall biosynthesis [Bradyrhizobium macuxiense]